MQLSRQQRINNTGSLIVSEINRMATAYRKLLKDGLDEKGQEGYPALKCTGAELRTALGDNLKNVETIIEFVLDGKTNRIMKKKK